MNLILISNYITPHQIPLCDALSSIEGVSVSFIETSGVDKSTLPIGWQALENRPYVISYNYYLNHRVEVLEKIMTADAVIIGSAPIYLVRDRLADGGLTFVYSERIYKNIRELIKWPYHLFKFYKQYAKFESLYLLCASAFSCLDYRMIGCFNEKAYKWGYFTEIDEGLEIESLDQRTVSATKMVSLMWCSRFLNWKHPELAIRMADRLKKEKYRFCLDMYGVGPELENIRKLAKKLNVEDVVNFKGSMPNSEIQQAMRSHEIFIFTSDKNEGWGAVSNEAMSNGCALVASSAIGSIPFLIDHKQTGCIFKSQDLGSLVENVKWLIDNPDKRRLLASNGFKRMRDIWSPKNAACNLVQLINNINDGLDVEIKQGPCSLAPLIKNNWFNKLEIND